MIERTLDGTEEDFGSRKMKKTRRGKKRKLRNELTPSELDEDDRPCAPEAAHETETKSKRLSRPNCLLLRPTDVPKAPENSTQFIMDDHEDCNLYFSFETQRRRRQSEGDEEDVKNNGNIDSQFVGFQDIDFEYESPDDVDTTAFYEKDFEIIYRSAREDELSAFSRDEMMAQCIELEQRAIELEHQMTKFDSGSATIGQLQEELLKLQEENESLRCKNAQLVEICENSPT